MKIRCLIAAAGLCLAVAGVAAAFDTVKTTSGSLLAEKLTISRLAVRVERGGETKDVPVNEIVTIYFEDEPAQMKTARTHLVGGRYEDALEAFNKVKAEEAGRPEVQQDLAFYKALCAARLALAGTGKIKDAGTEMAAFVRSNPQSFHYLEGCEVLGDLYVALGYHEQAEKCYAQVGDAPWPDYKMRAGVALGRAQLAQGKTAVARRSFEDVLAIDAKGDLAESQRTAATLGIASCLVAEEKPAEAIKMVEGIIARADPEQAELHARAYNTLGTALRESGQKMQALLAFLHVDVLYFTVPEAHAEALANLAELWDEMHQPDRAVHAREVLEERYRNSRWAKGAGR